MGDGEIEREGCHLKTVLPHFLSPLSRGEEELRKKEGEESEGERGEGGVTADNFCDLRETKCCGEMRKQRRGGGGVGIW